MKTLLLFMFCILSCQKQTVNPVKGNIVEAVYGLGIIRSENTYHAKAAIVNSVEKFYVSGIQELRSLNDASSDS